MYSNKCKWYIQRAATTSASTKACKGKGWTLQSKKWQVFTLVSKCKRKYASVSKCKWYIHRAALMTTTKVQPVRKILKTSSGISIQYNMIYDICIVRYMWVYEIRCRQVIHPIHVLQQQHQQNSSLWEKRLKAAMECNMTWRRTAHCFGMQSIAIW